MSEQSKRDPVRYPAEVRERAVRMVFEHQSEYPSQWKAIESIAAKLAINHETLRSWVRRAETDAGERPGLTTDERAQMKELERRRTELRRANEILKAAAAFFGAELDRRPPQIVAFIDEHRAPLRGRADLQGAHRARLQDRPEHLLGGQEAAAVGPGASATRS